MDFVPFFSSTSARRSVHHFKDFPVTQIEMGWVAGCLINSSLFYIWFIAYGNGRNVTLRDINTFPTPDSIFSSNTAKSFYRLFDHLMADYRKNSVIKKRNDGVQYQEFYPAKSKSVIDQIDLALAEHYGFTDDELDFIINYDIKYRMGRDG